jgi:hypothetical protein
MPEDLIKSWKKLEYILCSVVRALADKYKTKSIGPAWPAARGYQIKHAYRSVAHREARASRQIFVLWIGLLSYKIAMADSSSENDWPSILQNELGFHPTIADLIRASDTGTFSHEVQCVGVFLYLSKADIISTLQPSVRWFIAHNIPIWYQWDEDEVERAKHDPVFAEFGPLQGLPESHTLLSSPPTGIKTITWREFFKRREENCPRLLNLETELEREKRLNRERNPPIRSAKVFVWDRDPDLPGREEVLASERTETLEEYGPEQKRYDSYWNEWDCCFEFGRFATPSPEDMEDDYMHTDSSADEQTYNNTIDILPPEQRCPTPLSDDVYEQTDLPPDNFQNLCHGPQSTLAGLISDVHEILALHYGMVLPDLNQVTVGEVSSKEKKFWLRWIGACGDTKLASVVSYFWQTARGRYFVEFSRQILNEQQIICDFDQEYSPSFAERLQSIGIYENPDSDVPGKHLFVFLFDEGSVTVPWRLAVTTASDVLLVCRLNSQYLDVDLARFLALRGIPFRTLLVKPLMPPSISYPDVELYLPQRPFGYRFTKADYEAYLNCRSRILRRPCVRAAVLRGGYMWRLTIGMVSVDELLEGPVGGGSLLAVVNDEDDRYPDLLDDKLTHNEMDWLCGMYVCATGMFLSIVTLFSNHSMKSRKRQ